MDLIVNIGALAFGGAMAAWATGIRAMPGTPGLNLVAGIIGLVGGAAVAALAGSPDLFGAYGLGVAAATLGLGLWGQTTARTSGAGTPAAMLLDASPFGSEPTQSLDPRERAKAWIRMAMDCVSKCITRLVNEAQGLPMGSAERLEIEARIDELRRLRALLQAVLQEILVTSPAFETTLASLGTETKQLNAVSDEMLLAAKAFDKSANVLSTATAMLKTAQKLTA